MRGRPLRGIRQPQGRLIKDNPGGDQDDAEEPHGGGAAPGVCPRRRVRRRRRRAGRRGDAHLYDCSDPPAGPRGSTPAAYTRHARTHPYAAYLHAPRRSTLPGLLPVSHLRPIAEARAIDDAHSRRRGARRVVAFFPLVSISLASARVDPPRALGDLAARRRVVVQRPPARPDSLALDREGLARAIPRRFGRRRRSVRTKARWWDRRSRARAVA